MLMLKSLPQLASSYLNVQHIWPSSSEDEIFHEDNPNSPNSPNSPNNLNSYQGIIFSIYYVDPNISEEEKLNRFVAAEVSLSQKLADLPMFYSERLSLPAYFGFGPYSSSSQSSIFRAYSSIFEHQVKDKTITVKIYADLLVNEFRDAEKYWREHFLPAYHYAFPNPSIIERYGNRIKIVKEGNATFIVSQDGRVNCMEWKSRFLDDIAPEMKRKLETARSVIVKVTSRLLESGELMFFAYCCALEEHRKCSLRHDLLRTSQEAFFDKALFDQLSEYPTLTLSKTFEVRKTFR